MCGVFFCRPPGWDRAASPMSQANMSSSPLSDCFKPLKNSAHVHPRVKVFLLPVHQIDTCSRKPHQPTLGWNVGAALCTTADQSVSHNAIHKTCISLTFKCFLPMLLEHRYTWQFFTGTHVCVLPLDKNHQFFSNSHCVLIVGCAPRSWRVVQPIELH